MRVKNKCKRITALVLSAGLTLSMLPMTSMPVHAANTKKCNTVEELQAAVKDPTVDDIVISTPSFITVVPTVINPYSLQFCRVTPAFRTHVLYAVIARSITLFPSIVRFPKVTFSYVLNTE